MYVHDIYRSADFAGIRHFRQTTMPSGLISVEEIAQTTAYIDHARLNTRPNGFIIPMPASPAPHIPDLPNKSVDCKNIAEFVDNGVSAWREMLSYLGDSVIKVILAHAEVRKVEEAITASGLILPAEPSHAEFVSYTSTPEEIEALETMTNRINDTFLSQPVTVGNYL